MFVHGCWWAKLICQSEGDDRSVACSRFKILHTKTWLSSAQSEPLATSRWNYTCKKQSCWNWLCSHESYWRESTLKLKKYLLHGYLPCLSSAVFDQPWIRCIRQCLNNLTNERKWTELPENSIVTEEKLIYYFIFSETTLRESWQGIQGTQRQS